MAKDKKSVLLYCDIIHTVEELDDVDAGLLFKHYLRYINDQNPEPPNKLIKIAFESIKQNLKRDLKKWEDKSERNRQIAIDGWQKRTHTNASERKKIDADAADTVTDTDNDTDNDILKKSKKNGKPTGKQFVNPKTQGQELYAERLAKHANKENESGT